MTKSLIILAIGMLLLVPVSKSQIIYTDIDPDTTIAPDPSSGTNFRMDINNDGTDDYGIKVDNLSSGYEKVQISGYIIPNQVAGDGDTSNIEDFFPIAFDNGIQ